MEEKKLTDKEIVKVLGCCIKEEHKDCMHCGEYVSQFDCMRNAISNALDLIHRQKAEIERLTERKEFWENMHDKVVNQFENLEDKIEEYENALVMKQYRITELQKQVDELEDICLDCPYKLKFDEIEKQAVKDTAKEIYEEIDKSDILVVETKEYGEIEVVPIERLKEIIKSKGVEVE